MSYCNDWKTLLKELGSETDVLLNANLDSLEKTVIRLAGADPDLDNYEQYKNNPELNQSGFSALATGRGALNTERDNTDYRAIISGDPSFWSSSPLAQKIDNEGNPTGVYDTESRWHLELNMSHGSISLVVAHPTIVDYFNPIRCVKD